MSVRGLSGVGLTSAPHRTFADPAPPLPTYSATPPPPDPIIPDATYAVTMVKMSNQGTKKEQSFNM